MGPLELANHLKKVPLTHNRSWDLRSSFQNKNRGQRLVPPVGRPPRSADCRKLCLGSVFHVSALHWMYKAVPGDWRCISRSSTLDSPLTWQHFRDDLDMMWQHYRDDLIRNQIFSDLAGPYGGLIAIRLSQSNTHYFHVITLITIY